MSTRPRKTQLKPKSKKIQPPSLLSNEPRCLNCSKQTFSNGKKSIPIINYLEVANEKCQGSTEVISVSSAVNYIFKLPVTDQLTNKEGDEYGCCSDCSDVIRELYEGHKKLEGLKATRSVLGQIIASQSLNTRQNSSVTVTGEDTENISQDGHSVTNGFREPEFPQSLAKGVKRKIESQAGPASKSARTMELEGLIPLISKPCPTDKCTNCCKDLAPEIRPNGKVIKKGVTTGAVYGDNGKKSLIPLSTVLSSIFKLPSLNDLTEKVVFCSDCAKALMVMYGGNVLLSKVATAESHLNHVSRTIESIISSTLTKNIVIVDVDTEECTPKPRLPKPKPTNASGSKTPEVKGKRKLSMPSIQANNGAATPDDSGSLDQGTSVPAPSELSRSPSKRSMSSFLKKSEKINLKVTPSKIEKKSAKEVKLNGVGRSKSLPEEVKEERKRLKKIRTLANIKEYKRRNAKKATLVSQAPCPHCGKVFQSKNSYWMKRHIKVVHEEAYKQNGTRFLCMTCGRPCQNHIQKLAHEQTHLNAAERQKLEEMESKKRFDCTECEKVFTGEKYLENHLANKHPDTEFRRVHCEKCDFSCLTPKTLKTHVVRVHDPTSNPRFRCKQCSKRFKLQADLKKHVMMECDVSNRPHACDQGSCQKRFNTKPSLVLHLHQVHKLKPEEAREKHYPGLNCPKSTIRKPQMKKQHKEFNSLRAKLG